MKNFNLLIFLTLILFNSCTNLVGSKDLGNNFILFGGDRYEDRIIIYCSEDNFKDCLGGLYVLPEYDKHYDKNGNYFEYIDIADSNNNWIVAKSTLVNSKNKNFWIIKKFSLKEVDCDNIDCDSIVKSNIYGPFSKIIFDEKLKENNINLKLDKTR